MTFTELANKGILTQPIYEPGKPIDQVARELGRDPTGIVKLASNENPYGPSPKAVEAATKAIAEAHLYPDGGYFALRQKLAQKHGLSMDQFVIGNGSNEIIELLGHTFVAPGDECVMHQAAFVVYKLVTVMFGATPVEVQLVGMRQELGGLLAAITPRTKLVFLASPANPVGATNSAEEIDRFLKALPPHVILVFDEAYSEYLASPPDLRPYLAAGAKIIGLRTFSKIYGLASFRIGYGYGNAEMISLVQRARQPFNANGVGVAAAIAALDDATFVEECRRANGVGLEQLAAGFRRLGLDYVPGQGNFLLVKVGDGARIAAELQLQGLIVRPVRPYGLAEWVRITVGKPEQNERLLAALGGLWRG
jgi:histidinol-phosphate aminotransferase